MMMMKKEEEIIVESIILGTLVSKPAPVTNLVYLFSTAIPWLKDFWTYLHHDNTCHCIAGHH